MANTPTAEDRLREASRALADTVKDRALGAADKGVGALTDRLGEMARDGGVSMPKPHLPKLHLPDLPGLRLPHPHLPGRGSGSTGDDSDEDNENGGEEGGGMNGSMNGSSPKVTTIIEEIDVGLPISFVYDQWTQFGSFPSFMKKVENVDAVEDEKLHWKAQIWWSHREWDATILEQLPDERIVWRSEGKKGHVDGAVTFHEITSDLTRIIVVLEYFPQGLFERTANIWRAQGRRVHAELQHFRRHVMAHAVLEPDAVQGWRGVIEDGEVVESPEDHEAAEAQESDEDDDSPEENDEESPDDADELDEYDDEDEDTDEDEDLDEDTDEYDDEDELDDEEDLDEDEDEEDEEEYDDEEERA
ncbi:SRPBCC family protein [Nocardioides panacisoli]|uniref:Coenzyme Q-binding protein COQ10 START domain-containing protein n=1 Tax=Nocardioides panacisoli TaxID=627624 RepID=A0ABP7IIJ0_9ACTN